MNEHAPQINPEAHADRGERELPAFEGQQTAESHQERLEAGHEDISEIRAAVEENAAEGAPTAASAQATPAPTASAAPINRELKSLTTERALAHLRHNLSGSQKAFSKVIHQPVVRVTSDLGARTVGRPIALLVGGLCALVGSAVYLYLARHIGFSYNYLVSTLLFTGGLLVGIVLELVLNLFSRKKPQHL